MISVPDISDVSEEGEDIDDYDEAEEMSRREEIREQNREILKNKCVCMYALPVGSKLNPLSAEKHLKKESLCSCLVEINSVEVSLCRRIDGKDYWSFSKSELWDIGHSPKAAFDRALRSILDAVHDAMAPVRDRVHSVVLFEKCEVVPLHRLDDALFDYLNLSKEDAEAVQPD